MRVTRLVVIGVMMASASSAWALKDPETGQAFANTSRCGGRPAKAAGVGVREATFGIDVYAVVVYVAPSVEGKSIRRSSGCVKILARFVRKVASAKVLAAWKKSLKRNGVSPTSPAAKKFLSVITGDMRKLGFMVMETKGSKVYHKFMNKSVTVRGARKLARAIRATYLGGGSPTPKLIKDVKKRGVAKP